jgi:hypothetical protein
MPVKAGTLAGVDDISRHKDELRERQRELRNLLCEWDPIGGVGANGPRDEYDCLLGILGRLRAGLSEAAIRRYLTAQLRDHFGVDPRAAHPREGDHRDFEWYWRDPLREVSGRGIGAVGRPRRRTTVSRSGHASTCPAGVSGSVVPPATLRT